VNALISKEKLISYGTVEQKENKIPYIRAYSEKQVKGCSTPGMMLNDWVVLTGRTPPSPSILALCP
jgi:hypothetical protein